MARASLDNSKNEFVEVEDKEMGADYALFVVGQPVQEEKEMMEVTSPIKTKTGPTNVRRASDDKLSPTCEGKGKVRRQLKKIAREKGKNKSPTSKIQTQILGTKRVGKLIFSEEEAPTQKRHCSETIKFQNDMEDRTAVAAGQHRREP